MIYPVRKHIAEPVKTFRRLKKSSYWNSNITPIASRLVITFKGLEIAMWIGYLKINTA
jgi:hypothetical protein